MDADGMAVVPVRPLAFRELLDVPFALIQTHIRLLAALAASAMLLADVVVVAAVLALDVTGHGSDTATTWTVLVCAIVTGWLVRLFLRASTTAIGLADAADWRSTLARLRGLAAPFFAVGLTQSVIGALMLVVGVPLMVLFAPAVIGMLWLRSPWLIALPVVFAEHTTAKTALARSALLMRTAGWQAAGLWLLVRALLVLLMLPVLSIPLLVLAFSGTQRWALIVVGSLAILLAAAFTEVVESAARVVYYLDRRCRREGIDIPVPRQALVR